MQHEQARVEVDVPADGVKLHGDFSVPEGPIGVVLFAQGSGSNAASPRNRAVAAELWQDGLATLLFDLLTPKESEDRANVFDIELLAARLGAGVNWVRHNRAVLGLPIGLFGASTGAAAALVTAASDHGIAAVVSRGGRPDLAGGALEDVLAPTLLIVGGNDREAMPLNEQAHARLKRHKRLEVIAGATHLFEETGALEQVSHLAADWFVEFLSRAPVAPLAR